MEKIALLLFAGLLFSTAVAGRDETNKMERIVSLKKSMGQFQLRSTTANDKMSLADDSTIVCIANAAKQNGSLLDSVVSEWYVDSLSALVNSQSQKLYYDGDENQYLTNYYLWDNSLGYWYWHGETENVFDSEERVIQTSSILYNKETGSLEPYWREQYSYDSNGNMVKETYYGGGESVDDWEKYYQYNHLYDDNNLNICVLKFKWNQSSAQWDFSYYSEYTYDSLRQNTEIVNYGRDDSLCEWYVVTKEEMAYSSTGKLIQDNIKSYDDSTSQIEINYAYAYDSSDNLIEQVWEMTTVITIYDELESSTFIFEDSIYEKYVYQYTYDENENLTEYVYSYYDSRLDSLVPSGIYDYTYDDSGNLAKQVYLRNYDDEGWVTKQVKTYFYTTPNSVEEISNNNGLVKLYPNPVSDKLTVNIDPSVSGPVTVELFDLKGNRCLSSVLTSSTDISVASFSKGIYICNIKTSGASVHERIVIK